MNCIKDVVCVVFKEYNRVFLKNNFFHNIFESLSLKEENKIKFIKNLFRLKKKLNYTAIKDKRNIFRQEKETKAIKDRILRDINNLKHEEEENFWRNNYIEYESNGDRNENHQLNDILIKLDHI